MYFAKLIKRSCKHNLITDFVDLIFFEIFKDAYGFLKLDSKINILKP